LHLYFDFTELGIPVAMCGVEAQHVSHSRIFKRAADRPLDVIGVVKGSAAGAVGEDVHGVDVGAVRREPDGAHGVPPQARTLLPSLNAGARVVKEGPVSPRASTG